MKTLYTKTASCTSFRTGIVCIIHFLLFISSCKKQDDWLNVKSTNSLITPSTLEDYQALLDNTDLMNSNYAILGSIGTDNLYIPEENFGSINEYEVSCYLWSPDLYSTEPKVYDWDAPYKVVESANIVLDGISTLKNKDESSAAYKNVKGSALFFRSFAFYNLSQIFCKPYISSSASIDPGIPLRLSSDVNIESTRPPVKQLYDQLITDLKTAIELLPVKSINLYRPSKNSANALLAKVYLSMGDYSNAGLYATNCLNTTSSLIDFNTIDSTNDRPFPNYSSQVGQINPELIIWMEALDYPSIGAREGNGYIDTSFFASYDINDLRRVILYEPYNGNYHIFKGSYVGYGNFSGIATNEVYLIHAESNARAGNYQAALDDLNSLLVNRYRAGTYTPLTFTSPDSVLLKVLQERRKELPFTAQLRWEDLRRLNQDSRFAVTLKRIINSVNYELPPNDDRYVLPIPSYEISLSHIQQNPR
ncbi:MAG: hypothetical protein BGO55_23580 [Sphingobacteriales bacterium 50-39]|nr:RagB/SusD family nutrient uptake outer membrane protein [Sphingobacteriales bacterium]OJW58283.1 MAG: hypothetical protein BGO55_23580 [Sphingobacteriales bacterium 50-39]